MPGGTLSSELFGHKPNSELSDVKLRSPQSPATAVTIAAKHDMYGRSRYRSLHLLRTRYCTTYYRSAFWIWFSNERRSVRKSLNEGLQLPHRSRSFARGLVDLAPHARASACGVGLLLSLQHHAQKILEDDRRVR